MPKSGGKLRIAVVGVGFGKTVHVPAFRRDPRCEIVAIVASTDARARAAASELEVARASANWQEVVTDPGVDAVSIAVPPGLQVEVGAAALDSGKHVFFEKPLALTSRQSEQLVALAEKHRVATAVDFEFTEIDVWKEAKRRLNAGAIGGVRHAAVTWRIETFANRNSLRSWKTSADEGGGALNSFTSHCFFYLEWLLGPIAWLSASLQKPAGDPRPGDTLNTIVFETSSGVPVTVCVATDAFLGLGHRIDVFGEAGTLVLENRSSDYCEGFELAIADRIGGRLARVDIPANTTAPPLSDGRIHAVSMIAKRFVDAALDGVECSPNIRDGHRVQRLLDVARESDRLGRRLAAPTI